jgi:myosin-5
MDRKRVVEIRTTSAVLRLQSLWRGVIARKRCKAEIRKYVVVQCQWRRKQAVKELRGLRTEAKSASKFKERSFNLENKVVELTQALQKRAAESKELGSLVKTLEAQVLSWQGKHEEGQTRVKSIEAELAKPTVPQSRFDEVMAAKAETDAKIKESAKRIADQDQEIERLTVGLKQATKELEERQSQMDNAIAKSSEDATTIAGLQQEVTSLKEQISRSNALAALTKGQGQAREPTSPTLPNGLRTLEGAAPHPERPNGAPRRRARRHSTTGHGAPPHMRNLSQDDTTQVKRQGNRAVSVMFPSNGPPRPRDSNGLPSVADSPRDEMMRLLSNEKDLDEDVLQSLIHHLNIPQASLHNPPTAKEVLFPAHLITLVANEMWKLSMIPSSERFLANVMQAVQAQVMVSHERFPRFSADV